MTEAAVITNGERRVPYTMKEETKTLLAVLRAAKLGEVLTYAKLGAAIGMDVRPVYGAACHLLVTARRRALLDHRIAFRAIAGVGLERIDDIGKVDQSGRQIKKSYRAGGRAVQMATAIDDYAKLPQAKQIEHNRNLSVAGVLRQFAGVQGQRKVERLVANAQAPVPVMIALEAFKDS